MKLEEKEEEVERRRGEDSITERTGMDFASSTKPAEKQDKCQGIVAESSVVPR